MKIERCRQLYRKGRSGDRVCGVALLFVFNYHRSCTCARRFHIDIKNAATRHVHLHVAAQIDLNHTLTAHSVGSFGRADSAIARNARWKGRGLEIRIIKTVCAVAATAKNAIKIVTQNCFMMQRICLVVVSSY